MIHAPEEVPDIDVRNRAVHSNSVYVSMANCSL
jgi:hypothetical protein